MQALMKKLKMHYALEMRSLPLDSSAIEFHDKKDMLLNYKYKILQNQMKTSEIKIKPKKKIQVETKTRDEKKLDEIEARKTNMIYIQRLEQMGSRIILSKEESNLMKQFSFKDES